MPSDWRVERAWELAASSLRSAFVRLPEPVCSTLIRFLEKSWRFCTTERFEPKVEALARSVSEAVVSVLSVVLMSASSRKLPWPTVACRRWCRDRGQGEAGRGEVDGLHVEVRRVLLVELDVQLVRGRAVVDQVDAVVAGVVGELVDLGEQRVELLSEGVAGGDARHRRSARLGAVVTAP